MSSLEIYKASAGSGKTFRIVREYLRMVFQRPEVYKNILAVTFTNKATSEMKDRILKDLSSLASGNPSGHLEYLKTEFNQSEAEIRLKAASILRLILHDYSRFSISTIDSFFQRVIRAFSREMRLNASYRTELDAQLVLEEAVDRLFLEIDNNPGLKNWMLEYADENLREGRSWNFREDLTGRGKELFKEDFKLFSEPLLQKLADKSYLTRYNQELRVVLDNYECKLKEIGKQGLVLMFTHGLSIENFKYGKSSFATHFNKLVDGNHDLPGTRTLDACNDLDAWTKATDKSELKDRIATIYYSGLNNLLVSSIELIKTEGVFANTAKAILANLFSFGLLTDIALKVQEVSKEKNLILLNDSTQILRKVIAGSDSPFVYEKMGSVYRNFMLDEFQDTSRLQWHNFKPLIENSLGEGNRNIIVGDVKQSIYRWRNGDWNLLATQVEKDLSHFGASVISLDTNWRSAKKVIDFNNILFRESARLLNNDFESSLIGSGHSFEELPEMEGIIEKAYSDHYQKFSGKASTEGYVRLQFIDNEDSKKKSDYQEMAIAEMITQIELVQANGVRPGDIAILVRGKSEGSKIAKALLDRKISNSESPFCYDVISNDSLIIDQSPVVQFILNFFKLFAGTENEIVKADLVYGYFNYLVPLIEGLTPPSANKYHSWFAVNQEVPEIFKFWFRTSENNLFDSTLLSLPLFELASRIAQNFNLNKIKGELVYLEAFLDLVLQYGRDESGGIAGFLDWWKSSGSGKTITLSEGQNAISILTIHKSKGLEFHTVFVPLCDWDIVPMANKAPYLWCHPNQAPFDKMDLVLVRYGSGLQRTLFSDAYFKEMLYSSVDNLNLLYVAFTRAVNSLFVFCPYAPKLNNPYKSISSLIQGVLESPLLLDSVDREKYIDLAEFYNPETKILEIGEVKKVLYSAKAQISDNKELDCLILASKGDRLRLRIHSDNYFDLYDNQKSERIGRGKLLHELFEKIATIADVIPSLNRMVSEGKIDTKTSKEYLQIIEKLLAEEPFQSWFGGDWKVLNERDILRGSEKKHRPDRVMIKDNELVVVDYKTGLKSEKDFAQVRGYLKDFSKIGFILPKGYLWYLSNNEIIEVI
ncbi:MAG TPA: UvrD-helicase domain-containing protein [Prolixibacteraceae bacterium]|jgi:ATP-dependent exoDNAse (exonuclease V) beta subunit